MKTKLLLSLFISLFFMASAPCHAESASDEVWVAISYTENGPTQPPVEYYGTIKKSVLANILGTAVPIGFIKLRQAAWMNGDGKIIPLSDVHNKEAKRGYGRDMCFRVESIVRIIELDDQFVKDNAFDLTQKK